MVVLDLVAAAAPLEGTAEGDAVMAFAAVSNTSDFLLILLLDQF